MILYIENPKDSIIKLLELISEISKVAGYKINTQRDRVEGEVRGGIEMGNTCKSMADSFQCMTKPTTIL